MSIASGDRKSLSDSRTLIQELRSSKRVQEETEAYLLEKNVQVGQPVMAARVGEGTQGNIILNTNVFPVNMQEMEVCRYDVTITGIKERSKRELMFTKKFKDDFTQADRRFRCRDVIMTFMELHREVAFPAGCMYNDLQSIMYTLKPLRMTSAEAEKGEMEVIYKASDLHNVSEFSRYKLGAVKILFKTTHVGRTTLRGVSEQRNLLFVNRDLAQFLDIATSQEAFFREGEQVHFSTGNSYLYAPEQFGFSSDDVCTFEENDTYLAIGCQKAIQVIQGNPQTLTGGKNGIPAVIVQPKKTPFHGNSMLVHKAQAMIGQKRMTTEQQAAYLEKSLKGIMVETTHNERNKQTFPIKGIDRQTPAQKTVKTDADQKEMTVAAYFQNKYGITLNHPNMPLVIMDNKGPDGKTQKNYYPMEVLMVCDNQRVKTTQLTPTMTQIAIKKCAVPPAILQDQVGMIAKSMHFWDSEYLQKAGIQIPKQPMQVRAYMQPLPEIGSGMGQPMRAQENGTFRCNRVLKAQHMVGSEYKWAVFGFVMRSDRFGLREPDLDKFMEMYQNQARQRGIELGNPARKEVIQMSRHQEMAQSFEWAANNNVAFMLCFHGDSDDDAHHEIKANERRYFVISQCVRFGTLRNVIQKGQRLTVDNILNKTNVKLGGLNYTLPRSGIASSYTTLVIGFSSNHPGGGIGAGRDDASSVDNPNKPPSFVEGPPSVVGFAANVGPTGLPYDFVGDFVFQVSRRDEKINVIETVVQRCLHFFKSSRKGAFPEQMVIFRNGCSEGQYASLLKYEVPLLKKALEQEGSPNTKMTVIVCNKMQDVRFFQDGVDRRAKATDQNLKPGTTIDTTTIHPVFEEFYLNSHRALQGTARTPKYTVVFDEGEHHLSQLESMTYDLCYGHQIVFSPLSLPAPVYIANEYGKRGRNLYNRVIDELKTTNPRIGYTELNHKLTYYGETGAECWIAEYRINA